MRGRSTRRRNGQGLAEFALVFPIFILLLMAMIDLGRAVFAYNTITNSAREAARLAIVNQIPADVTERAEDMSTSLAITTNLAWARPDGSSCDGTPGDPFDPVVIGCIVTVEVVTDFQPITPVAGTIIGPITMTAESQIGVEFQCPNALVGAVTCPKQPD
jgi:hypothetical protein